MTGFVVTDTETTGIDPERHGIVQIGAIATDADFNIKGYFMSYCRPPAHIEITDEALAINKISRAMIASAPPEEHVVKAFHAFALSFGEPLTFAGYNCPFDLSFLDAQRIRCGNISAPYLVPWLDLLVVARRELKQLESRKLTAVAEHFGCLVDGAHDSVVDCYMTVRVARAFRERGVVLC